MTPEIQDLLFHRIETDEFKIDQTNKAVVNKNGFLIYLSYDGKLLPAKKEYSAPYKEKIEIVYRSATNQDPDRTHLAKGKVQPDYFNKDSQIAFSNHLLSNAEKGNWNEVHCLLDKLNSKFADLFSSEKHGHLIHFAARTVTEHSALSLVGLAKKFKNAINLPDSNGVSPIVLAIKYRHSVTTIRALLSAGADPSCKDTNGMNLLELAQKTEDSDIEEMLVSDYPKLRKQEHPQPVKPTPPTKSLLKKLWPAMASPLKPDELTEKEFQKQFKKAAESGDLNIISTLFKERSDSKFQAFDDVFSHTAIIGILDDDDRIRRMCSQFPVNYKPDVCLWNTDHSYKDADSDNNFIIHTGKRLNDRCHLKISGHGGTTMAGITGDKFAVRLDMWLTYNGCKKNETPLITLTSCSTGADFKDKELITSFAEELSRTLYALGRENKIVCSTGLFSPSNRGVSLCFQLAYNSKDRVNAWQGFDRWLDPSFQKENGVEYLHGLTEGNRKTNLIRLVYTNKSGKTKNEERFKSFEESRNMYTLRELN